MPLWRRDVDREVRAHAREHRAYLVSKGLVDAPQAQRAGSLEGVTSADK